MAEVTTYWTQDLEKLRWNKPGGLIPETLTLRELDNFHSIRGHYANCRGRKVVNILTDL